MKKLFIFSAISIFSVVSFAKGNCSCPFNTDKRGYSCGKRSAFCRAGGESPSCGTTNQKEFQNLFNQYCR